jgi:hypothetical protein
VFLVLGAVPSGHYLLPQIPGGGCKEGQKEPLHLEFWTELEIRFLCAVSCLVAREGRPGTIFSWVL